ncbi:hypothetical protein M422DRAFT_260687 [Sphaerobolus stellatus SS14]|uniref:Unplaced genomic scaffold SPHSTscaffold_99, whole genome shotgun sequence n=1 Tax=Sphaerobolus stellatus (strain SS14) TaxID=990650 RepID=A0A0C9V5B8_SPHS4|nr:hypothetical protein M422DRAFT_260687 [Sphaerobolus stellatus SS14]
MFSLNDVARQLRKASRKRSGDDSLDDPRNVKSIRLLNGMEVIVQERLGAGLSAAAASISVPANRPHSHIPIGRSDVSQLWTREQGEGGYDSGFADWGEEEPMPDGEEAEAVENTSNEDTEKDQRNATEMRAAVLNAMYAQEVPLLPGDPCLSHECVEVGTYDCVDCALPGLMCYDCIVKSHEFLPCHRPLRWTDEVYHKASFSAMGLIVAMGHGAKFCAHVGDGTGPQQLTVVDLNGIHQRLTNNLDPQGTQDVYKPFKNAQRQWRVVRAWKRSGIRSPAGAIESGQLVLPCVSCPLPGINLDADWEKHPDSNLIHTMFIGGDGNFRLRQHNKGGGEVVDPSLFGDGAFYAPNDKYKEFCRVRGGAPDDMADITCRHFKAGTDKVLNLSQKSDLPRQA